PKLPAGWAPGAAAAPEVATSAQPVAAGGGTGGLYGAPMMARDERSKDDAAEGRTVQLTVGPRTGRGE
ncbi:MAG: PPE domain-containing protein, partial [Mycobacterium sp.]